MISPRTIIDRYLCEDLVLYYERSKSSNAAVQNVIGSSKTEKAVNTRGIVYYSRSTWKVIILSDCKKSEMVTLYI